MMFLPFKMKMMTGSSRPFLWKEMRMLMNSRLWLSRRQSKIIKKSLTLSMTITQIKNIYNMSR